MSTVYWIDTFGRQTSESEALICSQWHPLGGTGSYGISTLYPNSTGLNFPAAAAAKLLQSCPTLCDSIDGSPPGPSVPGILQARTLEWVAISFSNVWKWSHSVVSDSSWPHGLQPTRLLRPWDFPGKSTGVGCHCLLQSASWADQKSEKSFWSVVFSYSKQQ